MRRIYDSQALEYDDEDPHSPKQRGDEDPGPRTVNWDKASHALLPRRLRSWAISVDVATDREVYGVGDPVGFEARLVNRIPFPVSLRTDSPVRWTWSIDGVDEASHLQSYPEEAALLRFGRSERKVFRRNWPQRIRRNGSEWEEVEPGEHTLGVRVNAPGATERGLTAETSFRIE